MTSHEEEIERGQRFEFGANWARFLEGLDDAKIDQAQQALVDMIGLPDLTGMRFLDAGSGSGLSSLVARRLGASVHSFDFDPMSVACTQRLKDRYFAGDDEWTVEAGSVLDEEYMASLGGFDVVYSWGVLHHTGAMWKAITNAQSLVNETGKFFIAIYNDQGGTSVRWRAVKKAYCATSGPLRQMILLGSYMRLWGPTIVRDILKGKPGASIKSYGQGNGRGMEPWRDVVDWVGGYPFEVAKPEEIVMFLKRLGFNLENMTTCGGGLGCNQFVFQKIIESPRLSRGRKSAIA